MTARQQQLVSQIPVRDCLDQIKAVRRAATLVAALLITTTGSLLHCGRIVGASDYAVGDAGLDTTSRDSFAPDETASQSMGDANDAGPKSSNDVDQVAVSDARPDVAGPASDAGMGAPASMDANFVYAVLDARPDDAEGASDGSEWSGTHSDASGPVCGQGFPTMQTGFDDVVRTCVLAVSCDPAYFQTNISGCITNDWLNAYPTFACLATIQDCDGYFQCQGLRSTTPADCPATLPAARCDSTNNVAIDCNAELVTNCDQYGGTCGTYASQGTTHAECIVAPSCADTDDQVHCLGNKGYTCRAGVGFGRDCSLESATCNRISQGCNFDGLACTTPGRNTCVNGAEVFCGSALQQFTYDCAAVGLACVADGETGNCVAPGCQPSQCPIESCGPDGKTLTVCVGGAPFAIDCTTIGQPPFTGCVTNNGGQYPNGFAHCQ